MMRFLVDAQLPTALKSWLNEHGFDSIHAIDLPNKDLSTDDEIAKVAVVESRILISKDSDFLKMKLINGKPDKLLLVTTGNIRNSELLSTFEKNFENAKRLFSSFEIVEIGRRFVSGRK